MRKGLGRRLHTTTTIVPAHDDFADTQHLNSEFKGKNTQPICRLPHLGILKLKHAVNLVLHSATAMQKWEHVLFLISGMQRHFLAQEFRYSVSQIGLSCTALIQSCGILAALAASIISGSLGSSKTPSYASLRSISLAAFATSSILSASYNITSKYQMRPTQVSNRMSWMAPAPPVSNVPKCS